MDDTLTLAAVGGFISLFSTSLGSVVLYSGKLLNVPKSKLSVSMDFVMGVMLSVTAFSLIGPGVLKAIKLHSELDRNTVFAGLAGGMIFVGFLQKIVHKIQIVNKENSSHFLLAVVLILHNFPEGMGAGASMAGMKFSEALGVQLALSVQNILEGLLLSVALLGMGWRLSYAVIGGVLSGVIEFLGALLAGVILESSLSLLPFLLALSGGAMLMSLLIEWQQAMQTQRELKKEHFALGFLSVPLMNILMT